MVAMEHMERLSQSAGKDAEEDEKWYEDIHRRSLMAKTARSREEREDGMRVP